MISSVFLQKSAVANAEVRITYDNNGKKEINLKYSTLNW